MATFEQALWVFHYAQHTPAKVAARNNNHSGHAEILDCLKGADKHLTSDEIAFIKPWLLEFMQEIHKAH